jgi:hexosaminidase
MLLPPYLLKHSPVSIINSGKMKKVVLLFILCLSLKLFSQDSTYIAPIIPYPQEIVYEKGSFVFSKNIKIVALSERMEGDINLFNDQLERFYGYKLEIVRTRPAEGKYIELIYPDFEAGWKDKYHLSVGQDRIFIVAEGDGAGFFYALQTLFQLLPVQEVNAFKTPPQTVFTIPCMDIKDSPRFEWRGMHLDVCRHFFPVSFVKRYIDLLSQYKFNTFHWHLTEDQGWRIEIKKYPLLTEVGSVRKGTMVGKYSDHKFDTISYGGFYTQEEIKDVVKYATERHVTIIPEIEMPGHSLAAIAAYPWLSCTGKKQEVAQGWGVFDDVYCSKDSAFNFLKDVLDEVLTLFPSKYIHVGGDECPKMMWKMCKNCQSLMKKEKLKNEEELQSFFIRRIEKYLNSKGRQIIGWDEILEGGLAPNAAVMSWRGTKGGIAAAKQKHKVVMTPGNPCYFDHYQSKATTEPLAIGGYNPVDSVYNYDPLPKNLTAEESKYILGAQGNVWTEYMQDEKQVEYMTFPRMCALAEVLWTPNEKKDPGLFKKRLKVNSKKLDQQMVNYSKDFLNSK